MRWKKIEGYEKYSVSDTGLVKNTRTGRLLKPHISKDGYYTVGLFKHCKGKTYKIHRLIALAFIPNPDNLYAVDHINANKLDNRIENLRWLSLADNNRAYRKEQLSEEEREKRNDVARKKVVCIETGKKYRSLSKAAEDFGVAPQAISACIHGRTKTSCGLHFEFLEESNAC